MRHTVSHTRIEILNESLDIVCEIFDIRHMVEIDLRQQALLAHLVDHIVRCADHIIFSGTVFNDRIHFLIGVEIVHDQLIAALRFEAVNQIRIDIVTKHVDIEFSLVLRANQRTCVLIQSQHRDQQREHKRASRPRRKSFSRGGVIVLPPLTRRHQIDHNQNQQHHDENQR